MVNNQSKKNKKKMDDAEKIAESKVQSASVKQSNVSPDYSDVKLGMNQPLIFGKKGSKRKVASLKVNPLPFDKIMAVIDSTFKTMQQRPDIKTLKPQDALILSGTKVEDLMNALSIIVPDNYEPRGKTKTNLKTEHPKSWKSRAVNKEAMLSRMRELLADGRVIFFRVSGKLVFANVETFNFKKGSFYGSVWHICQIRKWLFQSERWKNKNGSSNGYEGFFKPLPFWENQGLTFADFEKVLSLAEEKIYLAWSTDGWDTNLLKEIIKAE